MEVRNGDQEAPEQIRVLRGALEPRAASVSRRGAIPPVGRRTTLAITTAAVSGPRAPTLGRPSQPAFVTRRSVSRSLGRVAANFAAYQSRFAEGADRCAGQPCHQHPSEHRDPCATGTRYPPRGGPIPIGGIRHHVARCDLRYRRTTTPVLNGIPQDIGPRMRSWAYGWRLYWRPECGPGAQRRRAFNRG